MDHEIDINAVNKRGQTALYVGSQRGYKILILQVDGIELSTPQEPRSASTPLHAAGYEGHVSVVCLLLYCGADPTVRNSLGLQAEDESKPNVKKLYSSYNAKGASVLSSHIPKSIRRKLKSAVKAVTEDNSSVSGFDRAFSIIKAQKDWLVAPHNDWIVDIPSEKYQKPEIILYEDEFADSFYGQDTLEIIVRNDEKQVSGILSVQKEPVAQQLPNYGKAFNTQVAHKCLYIHSTGYELTSVVLPSEKSRSRTTQIMGYFTSAMKDKGHTLQKLNNVMPFKDELKKIEKTHSRAVFAFKVAVLYALPDQSMEEIWNNKLPANHRFYRFMNTIAEPINMADWDGYRGDLGTGGEDDQILTYYRRWNDIEIIFHLAPEMSAEQHRRLCGNDISVLIYFDRGNSDTRFVPFGSADMGTVPHIFCEFPTPRSKKTKRLKSTMSMPNQGNRPSITTLEAKSSSQPSLRIEEEAILSKIQSKLASSQASLKGQDSSDTGSDKSSERSSEKSKSLAPRSSERSKSRSRRTSGTPISYRERAPRNSEFLLAQFRRPSVKAFPPGTPPIR